MILTIIIIIFVILFITILSHYVFILTNQQVRELWISSILMIILLGFVRVYILKFDMNLIFLPVVLYIIWYFLTKMSSNLINKDYESDIIRDKTY